MSSFKRRVGAMADVKELEYIAALHQTSFPFLRTNGTVSSIDIMRFLKSRTNINVSHDHCVRIVRGLGGGIVGDDVIHSILQEEQHAKQSNNNVEESQTKKKKKNTLSVLWNKKQQEKQEEEQQQQNDISPGPFGMTGQQQQAPKKERYGGLVFRRRHEQEQDEHDGDDSNNNDQQQDEEDPYDDVNADDLEKEEFLDIVQLVSILLMPTLARAGKQWREAQLPQALEEQEQEPPSSVSAHTGIKRWIEKKVHQYQKKEQQAEKDLHASLDPKPANVIENVLQSMLKSVESNDFNNNKEYTHSSPTMNASLVKQLLLASGEYERAADAVLVDKMVEAALSHSGTLDEEALVNALTHDLQQWKVGCEDENTTSFYNVYGFESYREKHKLEQRQLEEKEAARQTNVTKETTAAEKQGSSKHLTKSGVSTSVVGDATKDDDDDDDDESVEDDIVPSMVGLPAHLQMHSHNNNLQSATDGGGMSVSGVSVITFDESVMEADKDLDDDDDDDKEEGAYQLDHTATPLDIDFCIDMHSSIVLTVLIFFFFMVTSLVYASLILQLPELNPQCGNEFGCTLGTKILTWMVFACILAGTGYFMIIPLSLGNQPTERSPRRLALTSILCLLITWIPYAAVEAYERGLEPPYSGPSATVNEVNYDVAQWVCRFLGTLTCLVMIWQFVLACIGNRRIRDNKFLNKYFSKSAIRGSAREKKAATRKINVMLENASMLSPKSLSTTAVKEETMMNFLLRGESFEEVGGIIWTWKRLLTGKLFAEDGVWIMTRLIIIQVVQFVLIIFYGYSGVLVVEEVAKQAQNFQDTLQPGYPDWIYTFVPTAQQAQAALYPAVGVALFVMITIFLIYIPSYVRTIFQFRCGTRPSLKSSEFLKYRVAVDAVYTNIGNAVFAMIGSAFIFFALIGLVLFLFIWPFSRNFMILLVAWGLGLCITIVIKMVLVKNCRKRFYAGFYRTNPNRANLAILALECWFIGMGGGVLVGRFTQFILAACFFVGRTDVPFLSKDVALFGYAFDYVPTNFVKDILVHEAHRHPYFERLLAMYLMKLKNDKFSNEAGACWRQLFVTTLMPWMIKLRVFTDKRLEGMSLEEYNARRLEQMSTSVSQSTVVRMSVVHPDADRRGSDRSLTLEEVTALTLEEVITEEDNA